jgi:hypothetical protein
MKDGKTTYMDHLQSVVRQSGGRIMPPELQNRVQRPERAVYLWNYFAQLSKLRPHDSFSGAPLRIPCTEILAWSILNRVPLQTFEVDLLSGLDDVFVEVKIAELAGKQKQAEESKSKEAVKANDGSKR